LHQRVVGLELGQPFVQFQSGGEPAAPGVIISQQFEGVRIPGIALDDAFEEPDGDIQLALLSRREFLPILVLLFGHALQISVTVCDKSSRGKLRKKI